MRIVITLVLLALAGCDFIGGADTLIRGSNNVIGGDRDAAVVADALADFPTVPAVSDEDLLAIYGSIRDAARAGDLQAAQVLLKLAALQRDPDAKAADADADQ